MAEQKQVRKEVKEDNTLAILDKRTNNIGIVSSMNEKEGNVEVVPADKKYSNSFIKLDRSTPLELFFRNFKSQYDNPSSFGFFLIPIKLLEKTLDAIVKVRQGEDPGAEGKKLIENSELNDEGRIAKLAKRYKLDEHEIPWAELNAMGITKEGLLSAKCMGEILKGWITSVPIPIYKEVNGERKELGNACISCIKQENGKVKANIFTVLDTPQYNSSAYKDLFTDEEKMMLEEKGILNGTKEMKDITTGKVCKCYVAYHQATKRIMTMPVDRIKIPDYIYGKRLDEGMKETLAKGGEISIQDIQRKNGTLLSGTAYVDARRQDIVFKQGDTELKVGNTIMEAKISPQQKKILEEYGMVFVENMKNPRTGQRFSDDVRYSKYSHNLLIGEQARKYKPKIQQAKDSPSQNRRARKDLTMPTLKPKSKKVKVS